MDVVEACCLLHIAPGSDPDEIKQSFRMEASEWHPDRSGDTQAMQRINEAREYLLSISKESRLREWRRLKSHISDIMERIDAERDTWEARRAARASVTNNKSSESEPKPSVTNKVRRAADWESRHREKVRAQTKKRVTEHRARNPDAYRAYMREYMKKKRAQQTT